jgi:hypothetical protein
LLAFAVVYVFPFQLVVGPAFIIAAAALMALVLRFASWREKIGGAMFFLGAFEALLALSWTFLWAFSSLWAPWQSERSGVFQQNSRHPKLPQREEGGLRGFGLAFVLPRGCLRFGGNEFDHEQWLETYWRHRAI